MRNTLFLIFFFCTSFSYSHDYFFAFAEVEYDEMNGQIEATITLTTHDLERILQQKGIIETDLKGTKNDSIKMLQIEHEILSHFIIKEAFLLSEESHSESSSIGNLKLDGFETDLSGTVQFYFSAALKKPVETIEVVFDLLMDEYKNQQNKITLIHRNNKRTFIFLPSKRTQLIDLN